MQGPPPAPPVHGGNLRLAGGIGHPAQKVIGQPVARVRDQVLAIETLGELARKGEGALRIKGHQMAQIDALQLAAEGDVVTAPDDGSVVEQEYVVVFDIDAASSGEAPSRVL